MPDYSKQHGFTELVLLALQGEITEDQIKHLDSILKSDPKKIREYAELIHMYVELSPAGSAELPEFSPSPNLDDWQALAEDAKNAPVVDVPKTDLPRETVSKVEPSRDIHKVSKFNIFTLISSVAAMLLLGLFILFAPDKGGLEVATLTDSIGAKWGGVDSAMVNGTRLVDSRDKFLLREGLAELTFDDTAKVIIEGPAEFQILADDRIGLTYGKAYATVPPLAIGFSIYTPNAKVIDLGTEFGVNARDDGDTHLHVIKGKTSLVAGEGENRTSIEVTRNKAKRVSGSTQEVSDITYDTNLFVRDIDSSKNVTWRGESIELSSIIAGGNGFSPVSNLKTLNPITGKYEVKSLKSIVKATNSTFNPVEENNFIDGVFVPDGESGAVAISSEGHQFDCPSTSGKVNRNIAVFYRPYDSSVSDMQPALFDGVIHGSKDRPCIMLHSNVGITIDLDRIRQAYPGMQIQQLKTGYGLTWAERGGKVDFFVLVDGVVKHKNEGLRSRENSLSATIDLQPDSRFLTFIVADSGKGSRAPGKAYKLDFFYLLNPKLISE